MGRGGSKIRETAPVSSPVAGPFPSLGWGGSPGDPPPRRDEGTGERPAGRCRVGRGRRGRWSRGGWKLMQSGPGSHRRSRGSRFPPRWWPGLGREGRTAPRADTHPPPPPLGPGPGVRWRQSGLHAGTGPHRPPRRGLSLSLSLSPFLPPPRPLPGPAVAYRAAALVPAGPLPARAVGRHLQPRSPRLLTRGFFSFIKTESCGDVTFAPPPPPPPPPRGAGPALKEASVGPFHPPRRRLARCQRIKSTGLGMQPRSRTAGFFPKFRGGAPPGNGHTRDQTSPVE